MKKRIAKFLEDEERASRLIMSWMAAALVLAVAVEIAAMVWMK